jgi:hypothetical protein
MTGSGTDHLRKIAEHYHEKATECRTKADLTDDEWARQSFLESAEFWMRLGVQAARRVQGPKEQRQGSVEKDQPPGEESE